MLRAMGPQKTRGEKPASMAFIVVIAVERHALLHTWGPDSLPSFAFAWQAKVRDLWAHTDNGTSTGALANVTVRAHATVVVRLTPVA